MFRIICLIPLTFVVLILPCRRSRRFLRGALRPAPGLLLSRFFNSHSDCHIAQSWYLRLLKGSELASLGLRDDGGDDTLMGNQGNIIGLPRIAIKDKIEPIKYDPDKDIQVTPVERISLLLIEEYFV